MQAVDNDIFYRLMNKPTNIKGVITTKVPDLWKKKFQMNKSFDSQNCCLDTKARICGYATTNIVKNCILLKIKYVRMVRFPVVPGPDMWGSTVLTGLSARYVWSVCSSVYLFLCKNEIIFQTTFSSAFSWIKIREFRWIFHWSLFLSVQLTIFQHWFR